MNLILLGPQGSGKGTQGELLSKKFGFYYFEAGGFLRELAKTNKEVDHIVNEVGALIPDSQMFELVSSFLLEKNLFDNILFDGYPRSVAQYEMLLKFLGEHGTNVKVAIALEIPEEETIRRLSSRRIDPQTHEIYNLITNPPPPSMDISKLLHREDDTEPVIKKRLDSYRSTTEPLVERLKNEEKLIEIDGMKSIDDIFSEISDKIAPLL